jgi:hypothetical protein
MMSSEPLGSQSPPRPIYSAREKAKPPFLPTVASDAVFVQKLSGLRVKEERKIKKEERAGPFSLTSAE